jgi:PAS domain S-box-containing protein
MVADELFSFERRSSRSFSLNYGSAVASVGLALIVRWLLDPLVGDRTPYLFFFLAVLFSALYGGIGPGLLAAVLSSLAARYFFIAPRFTMIFVHPADFVAWLLFMATALITAVVGQAQRSSTLEVEERATAISEAYRRLQQEMQERERVQNAFQDSERRFQTLADMAPVLIWMTDANGSTTYVNRRWKEFTGRSLGQESGNGWAEGVHPEDRERVLDTFTRAFHDRAEFRFDYRHRNASGDYAWILNHGLPRFASDGTFQGYIGSGIDISDRKADELRNALLLKFMTALSRATTPDEVASVIVTQGAAALGGSIGVVALLDADGETLITLKQQGLTEADTDVRESAPLTLSTPLTDAVRNGKPVWIESEKALLAKYPQIAQSRPGMWSPIRAAVAVPLRIGDRVIGGVVIGFPRETRLNVQQRSLILATAYQCAQAMERARLFEAEADARRDAEAANELKLRFLGMISHELRAPLHLIMGFADMLTMDDMEWDAAKLEEIFSIVRAESHKLTELVDQLLDASQLQAGTLGINLEDYPLSGVIEMARMELEKFAENHSLVMDIPDDTPMVRADPLRIGQVLVNLVNNAVKYSPPGSTITVAAHAEGDVVQIDISDEGEGIPPEQRETMFEVFQRLERDRKKRIKGVGLGLAIVKGLVEAHGGEIWVEDRNGPGSGTTFSFTIPLSKGVQAQGLTGD